VLNPVLEKDGVWHLTVFGLCSYPASRHAVFVLRQKGFHCLNRGLQDLQFSTDIHTFKIAMCNINHLLMEADAVFETVLNFLSLLTTR
jgi:hypothetical protein